MISFGNWSFQSRLAAGFVATSILSLAIAIASIGLLRAVAQKDDLVIYHYSQDLIAAEKLRTSLENQIALFRGYLVT